jgi:hypothetical protein
VRHGRYRGDAHGDRMRDESGGHDGLTLAAALAVHAATRGDAERGHGPVAGTGDGQAGSLNPALAAIPAGLNASERMDAATVDGRPSCRTPSCEVAAAGPAGATSTGAEDGLDETPFAMTSM